MAAYEPPDSLQRLQKLRAPLRMGKSAPLELRGEDYHVLRIVPALDRHKCQWIAALRAAPVQGPSFAQVDPRSRVVLYIAFKGSTEGMDALIDFSVTDVETRSGARVHSGAYSGVQGELDEVLLVVGEAADRFGTRDVVFTGHSLGGMYATIACVELLSDSRWPAGVSGETLTFGMPAAFHAGSPGGALRLPTGLTARPPDMTNLVANFDLVPRCLGWSRQTTERVFAALPSLGGAGSAVIKMLGWMGLGLEHCAAVLCRFGGYRPTGTYVFLASAVLRPQGVVDLEAVHRPPGHVRRLGVRCVQPAANDGGLNVAAEGLMNWLPVMERDCPIPEEAAGCSKVELLRSCKSDHSIALLYWPCVMQITRDPASRAAWAHALAAREPTGAAVRAGDLRELLGADIPPLPQLPRSVLRCFPDGGRSVARCIEDLRSQYAAAAADLARARVEAAGTLPDSGGERWCCHCGGRSTQHPVASMADVRGRTEQVALVEPGGWGGRALVRTLQAPVRQFHVEQSELRPLNTVASGAPPEWVCGACWRPTCPCRRRGCPNTAPRSEAAVAPWLRRVCGRCCGGDAVLHGLAAGAPRHARSSPAQPGSPRRAPVLVLNQSDCTLQCGLDQCPAWSACVEPGDTAVLPLQAQAGDTLQLRAGVPSQGDDTRAVELTSRECAGLQFTSSGVLTAVSEPCRAEVGEWIGWHLTQIGGWKLGEGAFVGAAAQEWVRRCTQRDGEFILTFHSAPSPLVKLDVQLPQRRPSPQHTVSVLTFHRCPILGPVVWQALCDAVPPEPVQAPKEAPGWFKSFRRQAPTEAPSRRQPFSDSPAHSIGEMKLAERVRPKGETSTQTRLTVLLSRFAALAAEAAGPAPDSMSPGSGGSFSVPDRVGCGMPEDSWDTDSTCQLCGGSSRFGVRQSHCRACGAVVCSKCSPAEHYLFLHGTVKDSSHPSGVGKKPVRVCMVCSNRLKFADPPPHGAYTSSRCG
eukprot:TRINITY_DN17185_c0_g1_i2.p1 TRINITY_DN17185_c0_g1~~TRINITY_DN17185_c0_g1_i2.p1  ORF type:complete len:977 (+),score=210.41 TRINITY_DN17185_c0_g1_i2:168-3098(+)